MRKLLHFLALLFLVACDSKTNSGGILTQIDKDVELADLTPIESPTQKINSVVVDILKKYQNLRQTTDTTFNGQANGLINVKELRDTVSNPYLHVKFSTYHNLRSSFIAFRDHVETAACCVPDDDIVKLKNYENLTVFKNGASKVMLTNNTVITMYLGDGIDDNEDLNNLVDSYFAHGLVRKLEIGYGGPATWTIK